MAQEEIDALGVDDDLREASCAAEIRRSGDDVKADIQLEARRKRAREAEAAAAEQTASSLIVSSDEWINDMYVLSRQLGKGSFATVMLAQKRTTFELVAVKIIDKSAVPRSDFLLGHLKEEMRILKHLAHPRSVIRVHQVIESPSKLFVVTEPCLGGDLHDYVQRQPQQRLAEHDARTVLLQVADAVAYLHGRGIVHRDIKMENVLLTAPDSLRQVKLADFSVSKIVGTNPDTAAFWMSSFCGTPSWMAPEIFHHAQHEHADRGYTLEVDLWSLGVLLYVLLSGVMPFAEGRFRQLMAASYSLKGSVWRAVSQPAKQLIRQLLVADPRKRLTIAQTIEHPWLSSPVHAQPAAAHPLTTAATTATAITSSSTTTTSIASASTVWVLDEADNASSSSSSSRLPPAAPDDSTCLEPLIDDASDNNTASGDHTDYSGGDDEQTGNEQPAKIARLQ